MPDGDQPRLWDEPRRLYADAESFLRDAIRLIMEDRTMFRCGHQMGHDVTKAQAEQLIFYARPTHAHPDRFFAGRWIVYGVDAQNRRIRIVASIQEQDDRERLCIVSAFEEDKPWGS